MSWRPSHIYHWLEDERIKKKAGDNKISSFIRKGRLFSGAYLTPIQKIFTYSSLARIVEHGGTIPWGEKAWSIQLLLLSLCRGEEEQKRCLGMGIRRVGPHCSVAQDRTLRWWERYLRAVGKQCAGHRTVTVQPGHIEVWVASVRKITWVSKRLC